MPASSRVRRPRVGEAPHPARRRGGLASALLVVLLLQVGTAGEAAALVLSQSLPQTESGQDFSFAFSSLHPSDGSDGILTIHARGDYDPDNPTEFLTWDLDSLGIGSIAGPLTGAATILQDNGINDVEWTQSFSIAGSDLLAATSDGTLSILLDLNLDDLFLGVNHLADTEFAGVSLAYAPIPEPSSTLLFAAGSLTIGYVGARARASRRRSPDRG
jgi:hypothetical protein